MVSLVNVGEKAICPRCNAEGKVGLLRFKKPQRDYWYLIVRHKYGSYCIVRSVDMRNVKDLADVAQMAEKLSEMEKRVKSLEKENEELRKKIHELEIELDRAKRTAEIYKEKFGELRSHAYTIRKHTISPEDPGKPGVIDIERLADILREIVNNYNGILIAPLINEPVTAWFKKEDLEKLKSIANIEEPSARFSERLFDLLY